MIKLCYQIVWNVIYNKDHSMLMNLTSQELVKEMVTYLQDIDQKLSIQEYAIEQMFRRGCIQCVIAKFCLHSLNVEKKEI